MRTLKFLSSRFDAASSVQLSDGRIFEFRSSDPRHTVDYKTPFSLETGEIQFIPESQRATTYPKPGFVTVSHLLVLGKAEFAYPYDSFDVSMGWVQNLSQRQVNKIRETFRLNGYEVTEEAIFHNLDGYRAGEESGFRDEEHGYHLYTGKRNFALKFNLTTLSDFCTDWQKTYWR